VEDTAELWRISILKFDAPVTFSYALAEAQGHDPICLTSKQQRKTPNL
jgi:hypothetical protein